MSFRKVSLVLFVGLFVSVPISATASIHNYAVFAYISPGYSFTVDFSGHIFHGPKLALGTYSDKYLNGISYNLTYGLMWAPEQKTEQYLQGFAFFRTPFQNTIVDHYNGLYSGIGAGILWSPGVRNSTRCKISCMSGYLGLGELDIIVGENLKNVFRVGAVGAIPLALPLYEVTSD